MAFDAKQFFDFLRGGLLGPTLSQEEVEGCEAVLAAMTGAPLADCAYALATAFHETNATMQPVREAYWLSEDWRRRNLKRYYPWYGRGYVQLTWEYNYKKADKKLGLGGALLANLDLAMDPEIAARIMRGGMDAGWFSRDRHGPHNFRRHLPAQGHATQDQFKAARWIINRNDKDKLIAHHALQFQAALAKGGW